LFELKPRQVATGRDPMLSVRASGAVSLLKVDSGNLWLHTSFDGGDSFEEPVRVNNVDGEVSSHGESSPQMQVRTRSEFYCLWQTRKGGDASALRFARSVNWGESFQKAIDVDPASGSSQSFFTLNVSPKGVVYAAWLDGRDRGKGRMGTSAVYIARSVDKGASFEKPVRVALDVCPCCRPSIAFSGNGATHVSWRGVLDNNVRDIFVASSTDAGATWSQPVRVAEDNWSLNGCPHSGAAMASIGKRLFVAWHTVRDNQNRLYLSYSDDGGTTFTRRADLSGNVLDPNHPFMLASADRIGLVFQGRDAGKGEGWAPVDAYYRDFGADGLLSPLERISHLEGSVSYPTLAVEEPGRLFVAWTEPAKNGKAVVMARGRRLNGVVRAK
jgi:hypothetical protein